LCPAGNQGPQIVEAERDHQRADQQHQPFGRYARREERSERRGGDAADDQAGDDRPEFQPDRGQECARDSRGDEELGAVDRADDEARRRAGADQPGGDDRSPTAATDGVEESAGQAEQGDWLIRELALRDGAERPRHDDDAHEQEVGTDEGADRIAGDGGQDDGAENTADDAGNGKAHHGAAIDIAGAPMGEAGCACREGLGGVDAGAGNGRRRSEREKNARRRDAVGHAERTVDRLCEESHAHEQEEIRRHAPLRLARGGNPPRPV
jgi:hypothetical protein